MSRLLTDEIIFDRVIEALVEHPCTFAEIFAYVATHEEDMPRLFQVDEALDVLFSARAIKEFRESRYGSSLRILALKSEARTWTKCKYCKGTGRNMDDRRCTACKGDGLITPLWNKS